jgi:putative DNA primase/helicase
MVAEGVEDALSLAQCTGYPAIAALSCSNLAALNPPPCSRLIIGADNDSAGMQAAEDLAACCPNAAIASPPARYKDWNAALCKADASALASYRDAISNAKPVEGERKVQALSMQEVLDMDFPPREFLLEPWLETESIAMLHARRGVGKTRFAMSVAYTVANKQTFLNWNAKRAARVLYVDGELPGALLQKRLQLLGPPSSEFLLLSRDILLRAGGQLRDLATDEGREFLDRIIVQNKAELIVLDSLSTLIRSGVENEAESWAPIQDARQATRAHPRATCAGRVATGHSRRGRAVAIASLAHPARGADHVNMHVCIS